MFQKYLPSNYMINHIMQNIWLYLPKKNNTKFLKNIEFVGPICETSDKFLSVKKYQRVKEKDFLLILDVGAYGMSLASNYCFSPKPAEILINKSNIKVIRKRENINKLIANN